MQALLTIFFLQSTQFIAAAVIAYFCGCVNGAVIVSKYILRDDVRNHGSGNAGLTNFYRTFGGPLTLVVILTDMIKAVVALLIGGWLAGFYSPGILESVSVDRELMLVIFKYWSGLFCLIGHMFPCMFHFRGGKGILSGGTVALMVDWRVALVVWGGFLILAVATRYVSLGSVWAGGSFPFISFYVFRDTTVFVLALLCGGLVVWKHRGNIQRLLSGTESKFSLHRKH